MDFEYLKTTEEDFRDENNNPLVIKDFQEIIDNPSKLIYFKEVDQKFWYNLIFDSFIEVYQACRGLEEVKDITKRLVLSTLIPVMKDIHLFFLRENKLIDKDGDYFLLTVEDFELKPGFGERFFEFLLKHGYAFPTTCCVGEYMYGRPVFYMNDKLIDSSNKKPSAYNFLKALYQKQVQVEETYFKATYIKEDFTSSYGGSENCFTMRALNEAGKDCFKATKNTDYFLDSFREYLEKSLSLLTKGVSEIVDNLYFIHFLYRSEL